MGMMLSGGKVADCSTAAAVSEGLPVRLMVHGDKGYDSNAARHQIEAQGFGLNPSRFMSLVIRSSLT